MAKISGGHSTAPMALAGLAVAAVLGFGLTGITRANAQTPPAGPSTTITARPGEACDVPGMRALADDGRRVLVCTTTIADDSPRWRTGQPGLPNR